MDIALNRMHFPVTTLGYGSRVGIWLQGCTIACKGCMSKDTWVAQPHHRVSIQTLLSTVEELVGDSRVDGITISGGEPFQQPAALLELLRTLRPWMEARNADADVLCYSGMPWPRLQRQFKAILAQLDVVVPEPFVRTLPQQLVWRGSSNQPMQCLSDRARRRYAPFVDLDARSKAVPRVQLALDDEGAWMIGLPDAAALQAIDAALSGEQLSAREPSWR